ncbi:MAG: hypothetical protein M1492_08815 [Gammaproteobacteria bacterium]|jgi:hypothetical protein|nr:hypothetical protein [Gammaproteobacteria bacterium]MDA8378338.1 hypothetical protein [Planctomycetia bacterium]
MEEIAESKDIKPEKKSFWERHSFTVMAVAGILVAGTVSFWFSGGRGKVPAAPSFTRSALQSRPKGTVLVLNAGAIMASAARYANAHPIDAGQASQIGRVVGDTIEQAAQGYAQRGYVVLSRGILAAPPSANITGAVQKIVMAKLNALYGGQNGNASVTASGKRS